MTLDNTLGNKIRSLRTLKGFTQENMAKMLGISPTAYAKIEQDITDVNVSRLSQIAEKLNVSIADLFNVGERISNSFNNSNQGSSLIITNASNDILVSHERLKTENEGLKKEVVHLTKIIALLEGKPNL
jgi:transcriptional regulator with XRE-family HTH domain